MAIRKGSDFNDMVVGPGAGMHTLINYPLENESGCSGDEIPESRNITVQVDYDDPPFNAAFTDIIDAIKIRYQWGVVGHVARADLTRGVPVTLSGPRLIVQVEYPVRAYTLQVGTARQPQVRIKCSIGVNGSKPSSGITGNARFTEPVGDIQAATDSAILPIPAWAISAVLQTADTTAGQTLVQFADSVGNFTIARATIGKAVTDAVPIANGARFFLLSNPGAAAVTDARVVFTLGL